MLPKNAVSKLPFGSQKSFTTNFSPEIHSKKAQQVLSYKNLIKGNKTANNEGIRFFTHPVPQPSQISRLSSMLLALK